MFLIQFILKQCVHSGRGLNKESILFRNKSKNNLRLLNLGTMRIFTLIYNYCWCISIYHALSDIMFVALGIRITVFLIVKILSCFLIINFAYNLTYLISYSCYVAATFCIYVQLMFLTIVHSELTNFLLFSYVCISNRKKNI